MSEELDVLRIVAQRLLDRAWEGVNGECWDCDGKLLVAKCPEHGRSGCVGYEQVGAHADDCALAPLLDLYPSGYVPSHAWHHFSDVAFAFGVSVGDRADCGWVVTQEWLDAPGEPPTMENTCPRCRSEHFFPALHRTE